jgi:hypothetical protein
MQPHNGATYKNHNWIKQFIGEGSKNPWMGRDTNQNMENWQQPDPQQDDWQQPVPQEGQPAGSSPTGLQPTQPFAENLLSTWCQLGNRIEA